MLSVSLQRNALSLTSLIVALCISAESLRQTAACKGEQPYFCFDFPAVPAAIFPSLVVLRLALVLGLLLSAALIYWDRLGRSLLVLLGSYTLCCYYSISVSIELSEALTVVLGAPAHGSDFLTINTGNFAWLFLDLSDKVGLYFLSVSLIWHSCFLGYKSIVRRRALR